ncbi:MAG: hypothetical protein NT093_00230 [Candidatus Moranbacteria bacterium]|nr:hypothetical protein [Candidatus Moranbacteria bacterium]
MAELFLLDLDDTPAEDIPKLILIFEDAQAKVEEARQKSLALTRGLERDDYRARESACHAEKHKQALAYISGAIDILGKRLQSS